MYLTLLMISEPLIACNNRGEGEGNVQTLQKVRTRTDVRTILSGYAQRRAIRDAMESNGAAMWRTVLPNFDPAIPAGYVYGPNKLPTMSEAIPDSPNQYDDTLLFGYMIADNEDALDEEKTTTDKAGKTTTKTVKGGKVGRIGKNRSQVEVSVAISTTPYDGDQAFTQGLKPSEPKLNPFVREQHYTRYQTTLTVNLTGLAPRPGALKYLLDTLINLPVGGNQASNASEMIPAVIAWRFHKTPGRGGLYLGAGLDFEPHEPVNLSVLDARCTNLGITCEKAGEGQKLNIVQGFKKILDEALPIITATGKTT